MSFEIIDSLLTINLNGITVATLAALLLVFGYWMKSKVPFFETYCIPTPVIGGFLFAILCFILTQARIVTVSMDTTYQNPFMLLFFASVGLRASTKSLMKGGKKLIVYLLICVVGVFMQNIISVGLSFATNISPMYGVMMGSQTLFGGHGGAVTYGNQLDSMGYAGCTVVGTTAATFGVICGSLFGSPLARRMVKKNGLHSMETAVLTGDVPEEAAPSKKLDLYLVFKLIALALLAVTIGDIFGVYITKKGFTVPSTMCAMFVGAVFRNLNDKFEFLDMDEHVVDMISEISLGFFLTISMMSLNLSQLVALALPMLIILSVEVIALALYAYFVAFPILGRDYDAAVMCAGMMGHGLGATPNAMANMNAITEQNGPSTTAYLVVPVVGAFLLDFVANVPLTTLLINILK